MAPHITEELWERRGHVESLLDTSWPEYDEASSAARASSWSCRWTASCATGSRWTPEAGEKEVRAAALASAKVREHLAGREVAKAVVVPGRLINLVTRRSA